MKGIGGGEGERGGEEGKGKDDLHPTLFLGPALTSHVHSLRSR